MDTKKGIRIKIWRKETYGTTQNKMVQPGTTICQEDSKELTKNGVWEEKRLETFSPLTCIKQKLW
jgi:hypothetical protein